MDSEREWNGKEKEEAVKMFIRNDRCYLIRIFLIFHKHEVLV